MKRFINNIRSLNSSRKVTNVKNLIKEAKIEKSKEKRKNILMLCAAASALTISGIIITL